MPEIRDVIDEAEEAFKTYPFDSDEAWHKFRRATEVSAPSAEAEERLRRAFFRKHVNQWLPIKRRESVSSAAASGPIQADRVPFQPSLWDHGRSLVLRAQAWCAARCSEAAIESLLELLTLTAAALTLCFGAPRVAFWVWMFSFLSLAATCYRDWARQPREWPGRFRLERALASDDYIPRLLFLAVGTQLHRPLALRLAMVPLSVTCAYHLMRTLECSENPPLWMPLSLSTRQRLLPYLKHREAGARILAAYAEVGLFAYLLGSLFTPNRSFLAVFVFYRYVQLRYLSCRFTRLVWEQFEAQLDMWSMWLPSTLRDLYLRGKQIIRNMTRSFPIPSQTSAPPRQ